MDSAHTCPQGWDLRQLLAYVDGDLPDAIRAQVEQHIKVCPFCAEELESLQRMHALLTEHVEAFHPDEEDLYRFVSRSEDPSGKIAAHLASCEACTHDAELLREMISQAEIPAHDLAAMPQSLSAKLGKAEIPPSPGALGRLFSSVGDLIRLPFRMPMLALGSAAAILLIVVICLPFWRSFRAAKLSEFQQATGEQMEPTAAGRVQPQQAHPDQESRGTGLTEKPATTGLPETDSVQPAKVRAKELESPPPKAPQVKQDLLKSKDQSVPQYLDAANRLKPHPAAPAPKPEPTLEGTRHPAGAVPVQVPSEEPREAKLEEARIQETKRPGVGMSRPQSESGALHREAKQDKKRSGQKPRTGLDAPVRVAVDVTDPQGRPIPWIHVSLPQGLERRFVLVSPSYDDRASSGAKFRVEIRVFTADGAYDVVCRLFDAGSGRELEYTAALPKSRNELPGAINLALQRLLKHR